MGGITRAGSNRNAGDAKSTVQAEDSLDVEVSESEEKLLG